MNVGPSTVFMTRRFRPVGRQAGVNEVIVADVVLVVPLIGR